MDLAAWPPGTPLAQATSLRMHSGGSPANVAVGLSRLGLGAGVVGCVGEDELGQWLKHTLAAERVDLRGLRSVARARTGLVFLAVGRRGEREFLHAREGTADGRLGRADVHAALVQRECRGIHLSSGPLRTAAGRAAFQRYCALAAAAGVPVSLDANLRPGVWPSLHANLRAVRQAAGLVDLFKCSLEEARLLTGEAGVKDALRRLRGWCRHLAVVTGGARGAWALGQGGTVWVPAVTVEVVDTTGAGDGFMAGVLAMLRVPPPWPDPLVRRALQLGAYLGARVCTRLGATAGLPRRSALPRRPAWGGL